MNRRVSIVNGSVVGNVFSEQSGVCARVCDGGFWGFASSAETDAAAVGRVLDAAKRNAGFLTKKLGAEKGPLKILPPGRYSTKAEDRDANQKILLDFTRELDNYIKANYPELPARTVFARSDAIEKIVITSDGAECYALIPRSHVILSLTAVAPDNSMIQSFDVLGGGAGFFCDQYEAPEALFGLADMSVEKLMRKRDGIFTRAGVRDVILDSSLAGILAHEAIGHTTEADLVLGGSVAGPYLNKKIASEMVTLIDYANTAFGQDVPQPIFCDDEGTAARDAVIIENGILKGYMHSRESAERFGCEPTGNARAYLFSDEPLIRMRNTAILPGKDKLEDMIASIDDGYYLTRYNNGQADLTSEFMFGIVMGYEIKNGKLGSAIRDTTISGVAFDVLQTVTMLSDQMTWDSVGTCGKKQPMPCGMGGPAVKCKLSLGGR
jgi:TldD protein